MEQVKVIQVQVGIFDTAQSHNENTQQLFTWADTSWPALSAARGQCPYNTYREVYVTVDGHEFAEFKEAVAEPKPASKFVVDAEFSWGWEQSTVYSDVYDSREEAESHVQQGNSNKNGLLYRVREVLPIVEAPKPGSTFVVECYFPDGWDRSMTLPNKYSSMSTAWADVNALDNGQTYRVTELSSPIIAFVEGAD